MSDLTEFLEAADDTTMEWNGIVRVPDANPDHAQTAVFVCVDRDFENRGPALFAMASAGTGLEDVSISIHAFLDGQRVAPTLLQLGDELIVTVKNPDAPPSE